MHSKMKIFGHPIHPMLIAYPVAFYTATLVGFAIYAATRDPFWLRLTIAANVAAVVMALVAALPGFVDWAMGIPSGTKAKSVGLIHMVLNVAALALFAVTAVAYLGRWSQPAGASPALGLVLSALGVALTIAAGFQGWRLVQDHHVGVKLTREQERLERAA